MPFQILVTPGIRRQIETAEFDESGDSQAAIHRRHDDSAFVGFDGDAAEIRRAFGGDVVAAFGVERNGMSELPGERRGPGAGRQDQLAGLDCAGFMPQDEAAVAGGFDVLDARTQRQPAGFAIALVQSGTKAMRIQHMAGARQ